VEEKRPTKSNKLDRKDEGAASDTYMLKQIRQIYREGGHQPIPYFKLICNPNNFMGTVQNEIDEVIISRKPQQLWLSSLPVA